MVNVTDVLNANITSATDLIITANLVSGNMFFNAMWFAMYIILYVMAYSRTFDGIKSLIGVSFAMFVISLFALIGGFLSAWFVAIPVLLIIAAMFSLMKA